MKNHQLPTVKYNLKSVAYLLTCILTACLLSCDKVDGPEPNPGEIPQSTAKLLTDSFPNAKNVVFKTIQANALWEARFEEGQVKYYIGLQPDKIVAVHKMLSDVVPDSMQQIIRAKFPIAKNATLSDYREQVQLDPGAEGIWYRAKVTADGDEFVIKWAYSYWHTQKIKRLSFGISEYCLFEFDTDVRYNPLPQTLIDLQNSSNYIVITLRTKVIGENKIHYHFNAERNESERVITNGGIMIGSYNIVQGFNTYSDIPESIWKTFRRFGIDESYFLSIFSGKCLENNYSSYTTLTTGAAGGYRMFFDENGKLTIFMGGLIYEY